MSTRNIQISKLIILFIWIGFIFCEATGSKNLNHTKNPSRTSTNNIEQTEIIQSGHYVANVDNLANSDEIDFYTKKRTFSGSINSDNTKHIESIKTELDNINFSKFSLDDLSANIYNKTELLENIYQKTKDEKVLKVLINELLSDYQFDKVKSYLSDINILSSTVIDKQSYIYTYINTLSATNPNSINNFIEFIEQLKSQNLLGSDEYLFYKGLCKIWDKQYDLAIETFSQISNQNYSSLITQLKETVMNYNNQKGMPKYYEDALVSLIAMKNGYFSIANKLSIDAVLEDNNYILPYQILAYSNFLTKNREKAITYFYDLSSLDIENKEKYDFYMGISYYWLGNYEQSTTTLLQLVENKYYKSDVYRYLLLNYEKLNQSKNMVQVRQKLLGEDNLLESDFKYFFDIAFYKPFSIGEDSNIFLEYGQMSYDFISMCYDKFGYQNDTCIYGEVGLDIVNKSWDSVEENLIYLANNYPQTNIYQALGDYYKFIDKKDEAKQYYLKALSMTDNSTQKTLMENSIINLME